MKRNDARRMPPFVRLAHRLNYIMIISYNKRFEKRGANGADGFLAAALRYRGRMSVVRFHIDRALRKYLLKIKWIINVKWLKNRKFVYNIIL